MMRGMLVTATILIAAIEPMVSPVRDDPIAYAVTQGGLFGVVIVLLWYIKIVHKDRLAEKDEKIQVLVDLVSDMKIAVVSLTRTVEKIDERRERREHS